MYGYLGIIMWASCFQTRHMKYLWNTQPFKGPLHEPVRLYMSRNRWEQIDKHFHVTEDPQPNGKRISPF